MECPKAALFDLDDTLSPPHVRLSAASAEAFARLLGVIPVGIATAAPFFRIERDVLGALPAGAALDRLYIFSENGAQCRAFSSGAWRPVFSERISDEERAELDSAMQQAMAEAGVLEGIPAYSERIIRREAGATLSTLGADAPQRARETWDPDGSRRAALQQVLAHKLPRWRVFIGGLTSIDISRPDVNKARAVRWMSEHLNIPIADMLYVGDALYEGGNDFVVVPTGIRTRAVSNPAETREVMRELIAACS